MRWLWRVVLCVVVLLDATGVARGQGGPPASTDAPPVAAVAPQATSFRVEFSREVLRGPYTGRLYIALSPRAREPRLDMGDWFSGPQVISMDVAGIKPGELVDLSSTSGVQTFKAATYADLPKGTYFAQAIARVDPDHCRPGMGEGDLCSEVVKVDFDPKGSAGILMLRLSKSVKREVLGEDDSVKLVEVHSELLSRFHGRDVTMRAGVFLPPDWKPDAEKAYPVIYFITGFGGDHTFVRAIPGIVGRGKANGVVFVVPDPTCHTGHSVFADSANNGPWGEALLRELIPTVEARFHAGGAGLNRYVTGISSGGWSSLWLQAAYPEDFNGCWSHCPDPVDFRDFQQIDLSKPGSMFRDEKGERRPIGRNPTGSPMLYYDDFVRQESVMGPGGQIGSFEAVFSPRGEDGNPAPLFDRVTGAIDASVARQWEKYDIRLKLEREWPTLAPKLQGKIHVYAGEKDSFYLEGAARLLKASLVALGSDADIQIIPGMIHTIYRKGVQDMMRTVRGVDEPPAK